MCCFFTLLVFLGPRIAGIFWWLFQPARWVGVTPVSAFDTWIWPVLGLIFLPFTTIMYVIVAPGGALSLWDWLFLILAVVIDIGSYTGGGWKHKDRIPGMS
jgi:hypothetical protein